MRISPVAYFNTCRPPVPSFKSNELETYDKNGEVINRNVTELFRPDLRWKEFTELLAKKYERNDNINLIDYACSDGSEAYTIVLSLINYTPENLSEKVSQNYSKRHFDKHILSRAMKQVIAIFMPVTWTQ